MRRHLTLTLLSLLLVAIARPLNARPRETPDIEKLIDRLTSATTETFHGDSNSNRGSRFWLGPPVPEERKFDDFDMHAPELEPIVACGVAALPALLRHVTDERPTKAGVPRVNAAMMWGDRYEFRFADPLKQPPGVDTQAEERSAEPYQNQYTQAVGDLCFSAIGQIVNRNLHGLVARPGLVVNSPVRNPALAAAVRQDWTGLSEDAHRRSLVQDLAFDNGYEFFRIRDALDRLIYYYPKSAEPVVLDLLRLPVDDSCDAYDYVSRTLVPLSDADEWRRSISAFEKEHGRLHSRCLYLTSLTGYALFPFPESDYLPYPREADRLHTRNVLRELYPGRNLYRPPMLRHTFSVDMSQVVQSSSGLRYRRIDEAVLGLLRRLQKPPEVGRWVSHAPLDLGLDCVDALAGKRWDGELKAYCERELASLDTAVGDDNQREAFRQRFEARLARLSGR